MADCLEIHPAYADLLRSYGLDAFDGLMAVAGETVERSRGRDVVRLELEGEHGRRALFLKREHAVKPRDVLRPWRRGWRLLTKAEYERRMLAKVAQAGFTVPEVAALGRRGSLRPRGFLMVAALEGFVALDELLKSGPSFREPERRSLLECVGQEIARLHAAGFEHVDLFAKHVFVRRGATLPPLPRGGWGGLDRQGDQAPAGSPQPAPPSARRWSETRAALGPRWQVALIDFQRARHRSLRRLRRWRELAALQVTLPAGAIGALDWLRLVEAYLAAPSAGRRAVDVELALARIAAHLPKLSRRRRLTPTQAWARHSTEIAPKPQSNRSWDPRVELAS